MKAKRQAARRPHLLDDPFLAPYAQAVRGRADAARRTADRLKGASPTLAGWANAHLYFGLHRIPGRGRRRPEWVFREWAPNASSLWLVGDFSSWRRLPQFEAFRLHGTDVWECRVPADLIRHLDKYHLLVRWNGGEGERIPAYARYAVQDPDTKLFSACVWDPPRPYRMRNEPPAAKRNPFPRIYEAHVGMAGEEPRVHTYDEFRVSVLPRIKEAGYDTVQLMGVMEHPYYGSFGYHVSSFYAASSRFGTPDDLKALVDAAHGMGLRVIMDIVHSHAVANERDGLSRFDGTEWQYFHSGAKGRHPAWGSRCFDYGKTQVLHFLLSNCKFWLEEYGFDGYRFDGVTSMLFRDHGLGTAFTDYSQYFGDGVDGDAWTYLQMANRVVHETRPGAITVAEDVSGLPGVAAPADDCGLGFDYRMAMGEPDYWFALAEKIRDEDWSMGGLYHALTDKRPEERTVSYVESHDQALVGGKTFIFQCADSEMYRGMRNDQQNVAVERAVALHKMARLATFALNGGAYLDFMGNEFGHPEWIDFPREENGWDYSHARRLWSLRDDPALRFGGLARFDAAMLKTLAALDPSAAPFLARCDEQEKILAFMRGGFLFAFNFHPSASREGCGIPVPPATSWRHVLDTDAAEFCGQGRIAQGTVHRPVSEFDPASGEIVQQAKLYLPARTAAVLALVREGRRR